MLKTHSLFWRSYSIDYQGESSELVNPMVDEYKYDADGKLTEMRRYQDDGNVQNWIKTVYKYNSDGNFTRVVVYGYDSKYVDEEIIKANQKEILDVTAPTYLDIY